MAKYLLNSAVITRPGLYRYTILTEEQFVDLLMKSKNILSRVGYEATKRRVEELTDGRVSPRISRETSPMYPGDTALVIRLRYRVEDPKKKCLETPSPEDWEYGLLVRLK